MRKVKQTSEKTPPLPKDKPHTYDNKSKGTDTVGNRKSTHQSPTAKENADPQKTRENLEMDTTKKERDPGMTKK